MVQNSAEGNILLIDKPYKWTSFDVVKKIRKQLGVRKVGHAGTLDPLATGLLIICTGKMTKQISSFLNLEKEYIGKMVIGKTTPSFDLETDFDSEKDWTSISKSQIIFESKKFLGEIDQIPPIYSAIKVNGKRAYEKARSGEKFKLHPRSVTIKSFNIIEVNLPEITFKVVCSKGTYMRSLVRDFGKKLGVGAYLANLKRTRIGNYKLEDAKKLDDISAV